MKSINSTLRRALALILTAVLLAGCGISAFAADVDYRITSAYADVNWQTFGQYRANLHCHTVVSDGSNDFAEMIEKHYALDYDVLSITDHGTVDYSWTDINVVPVIGLIGKFKNKDLTLTPTPLTEERFAEITAGTDRDGRGMLRVPYGIEHNPTSFNNAHVNSWFADCGDGVLGGTSDYETVLKRVDEAGGLSVINHPGEYTSAKEEDDPEKAYNSDYDYYINKFTSLLLKYDSCIGLDINSKTDGRTRNDRKLWDLLLANCIPNGRNVLAIATSDAHRDSAIDSGWTIMCMPSNTVASLRESMEKGAFFAGSRFIENRKELGEIGAAIGEDLGVSWRADPAAPEPRVNSVTIDDAADTISLDVSNAKVVRWIADGVQIATGATVDLDDCSDKIGSYVRAEIFGDGGILYTQAFTLDYDGAPAARDFSRFFDFGVLVAGIRRTLLGICNIVPFFPVFWKLITGYWYQVAV